MTQATVAAPVPSKRGIRFLWDRQLDRYPSTTRRYMYLGIVVLVTITLYYLYYVEGTVTPLFLPSLHMSFQYFLYLLVVSNAVGAFSAFIGGLTDKIGRANLTILGTLVVGLIQLLAVPNIHTRFPFAVAYVVIGFVEGIILVSTPALIRDFSPQMGRAAAMGFWALGPVLGSLVASLVATHTLDHLHPWEDQFIISGLVCMAVVLIALVGLRELAPGIRDQLMVTEKERALVDARSRGINVEAAIAHPLRSMLRLDLISSGLAIALFLLIYYASVSVLTIYWVVVFNRTNADANGINLWYWAADAIALIAVGLLSDRVRVRKPFMVIGATGTIVMTLVLIAQAGHPHATYYDNVIVVVLLGLTIGCAYTPWMAGYTEAVEAHNPALAATGLAVWGWILRIVVAISFLALPLVITTATTLVDNQTAGAELQALEAAQPYAPSLDGAAKPPAPESVLEQLRATGKPAPIALATLLESYAHNQNLGTALAAVPKALQPQITALLAFQPAAAAIQRGEEPTRAQVAVVNHSSPNDLGPLLDTAKTVIPAQQASPNEWKRWWWVCLAGQVVFLVLVFFMRGPWSPRAARRTFEAHERTVEEELAKLRAEEPAVAGSSP
jgi:MFS family permease